MNVLRIHVRTEEPARMGQINISAHVRQDILAQLVLHNRTTLVSPLRVKTVELVSTSKLDLIALVCLHTRVSFAIYQIMPLPCHLLVWDN